MRNMNATLEVAGQLPKSEVLQNGQVLNARLISVREYDQMIAHRILTSEDRVELLNGIIVEKMTKGPKHASVNGRANRLLNRLVGERVIIRIQDPIWLNEISEPEPDIVLAKPEPEFYSDRHPAPEDILLLAEISDTSLGHDRFTKGLAYAKAGIRQYLVLNLPEETVEDYRSPEADGYGSKQTYHRGEVFSLDAFPEVEISVDDLF